MSNHFSHWAKSNLTVHFQSGFRWSVLSCFLCVGLVFAGAICAPLSGQEESPPSTSTDISEEDLALKKRLISPQATIETFLEAMETDRLDRASECLDLAWMDVATADVKGKTYADKIFQVLGQIWVDQRTWKIPNAPTYDPPFDFSELLTEYLDPEKFSDARLIQLAPDEHGLWRFTRATLESVDGELWEKWNTNRSAKASKANAMSVPVWLESQFPAYLRKSHFLIKDYQWILLILLTVVGYLVGRASRYILNSLTSLWFRWMHARVDDQTRLQLWVPVSLIINAMTWYFGAKLIDLPVGFLSALLIGLKFFSVVIAVWTAFRIINVLGNYMQKRAGLTATRTDDALIPLVCNLLKIVSVLMGLILFVDVFELDWKTVMGGFGVGGIALAIASKEVLGNFFGSITVLTDRPFEIGDTVSIDGNVEGTVESVGMRSSRIRTFYNSEVVVPNSLLTTAIVDNLGRRQMRRFKTMLHVTYDTPVEKIDAFCAGVRQIIKNNPYAKEEKSYVYMHDFFENSIGILVYVFFAGNNWETELRERHCILGDTLRLAEQLGVEFAFPTRTLNFSQPSEGSLELPESLEGLGEFGRRMADKIQEDKK